MTEAGGRAINDAFRSFPRLPASWGSTVPPAVQRTGALRRVISSACRDWIARSPGPAKFNLLTYLCGRPSWASVPPTVPQDIRSLRSKQRLERILWEGKISWLRPFGSVSPMVCLSESPRSTFVVCLPNEADHRGGRYYVVRPL